MARSPGNKNLSKDVQEAIVQGRINGMTNKQLAQQFQVTVQAVENTMRPWALRNIGCAFVFQQDNDPKHTSLHGRSWFQRRRVDVLDWPSQSPDLNPIEHLWEEFERKLAGVRASNANEKFAQLEAAWKAIPLSVVHALLDSMPRRCQAVIDAKGFATKY
uniref:DDE_3 domain-containing protein n=2 Tax=Caenorhabditis japonica TaxID=281687 RepID=A0A8R1DR71_CAEJA